MTATTRPDPSRSRLRVAVDVGGTFTDIAVFDDTTGALGFGKAPSTPARLVDGVNAAPCLRAGRLQVPDLAHRLPHQRRIVPQPPDRGAAGDGGERDAASVHGVNPETGEFFIGNFGPLGGGWGAKRNEDGVSGTVCINDGDTHNSPSEQVEAKFPLVVER